MQSADDIPLGRRVFDKRLRATVNNTGCRCMRQSSHNHIEPSSLTVHLTLNFFSVHRMMLPSLSTYAFSSNRALDIRVTYSLVSRNRTSVINSQSPTSRPPSSRLVSSATHYTRGDTIPLPHIGHGIVLSAKSRRRRRLGSTAGGVSADGRRAGRRIVFAIPTDRFPTRRPFGRHLVRVALRTTAVQRLGM